MERISLVIRAFAVALVFLVSRVQAQVFCVRAVGHTPFYERIFLPKGAFLRPPEMRGVDDLGELAHYPETNRIDQLFAVASNERTNAFRFRAFQKFHWIA